MNSRLFFIIFVLIVGFSLLYLTNKTQGPIPQPSGQQSQTLGETINIPIKTRTKTSNCLVNNSLPDSECTPGKVENVTKDQVCQPGYAKSVRNVSQQVKNEVYKEYNITTHTPGQYEVDHLVSLELGGSNDIANLWPEAADPRPGYHEKDKVENYLHDQVCQGVITLEQAQEQISNNWLEVYTKIQ